MHENYLHCRLSLKKRLFIGNTSMDPQLSLLMANLTKVDRTHLVFDPFVGTGKALKDFKVASNIFKFAKTGSILLACTQLCAQVIASDIDI